MDYINTSFTDLLDPLARCFRPEVFALFQHLSLSWIICLGRRTISRLWQTTGRAANENHAKAYRLFSEAAWNWDEVARLWFLHALARLVPGATIRLVIDDTLCHKRGAKVAFGGIFLDPVLSSKRHKTFRFGVNYVTLGLLLYLPFRADRPFCINLLWRTCQKKKGKKDPSHKTKPALAREMIDLFASWVPRRHIEVLGDVAYVGKKVLKGRAANVDILGPLTRRAALYQVACDPHNPGKYLQGEKLSSLKDIAANPQTKWSPVTIEHPRRTKKLEVHELREVCWPGCNETHPVVVVLLRDPKGHWRDEILMTTNTSLSAQEMVVRYLDRWYVECAYADSKQHLGLCEAHVWNEQSVERTHPMAWFVGGLVIVWYEQFGQKRKAPHRDRPWYRQKKGITFTDMLSCAKLEVWSSWLQKGAGDKEEKLLWWLDYVSTAEG